VAVSVRFLLVSVGKSYEGRAATSLTQLGTDAAVLGAERLKEAIEDLLYESPSDFPIDPKLDAECYIRDDDGSIMGKFGNRTPDGQILRKGRRQGSHREDAVAGPEQQSTVPRPQVESADQTSRS
jgi:hypothetical protein